MSNLRKTSDFDADRVKFKGDAANASAAANTSTNLDYKITDKGRLFTGLQILAPANIGDYARLIILDKDNVLGYGANVELEEFVKKWFMDSNNDNQGVFQVGYPAWIIENLYIRITYTNVSVLTAVNLRVNYYLHKDKNVT